MKMRMIATGAYAMALCVPGVLVAQAPAKPAGYAYTVTTHEAPRAQGAVNASGITWQCDAKGCSVTGPWPAPGIGACRALAQKIGPIRSYGHARRQLSAAELEKCNAGVSGAAVANKPATDKPAQPGGAPARVPAANAPTLANSGLDNSQLRQGIQLRTHHYAALQRAREQAAEEARRREAQEQERLRQNSARGNDCDDTRRDVHPGAAEICDGRDNNCDGFVDEGQTTRRYLDADGDGHGDPARALDVCPYDITQAARSAESTGGGWLVEVGNDCNDQDPARWRECS
jgi:hypothetical protein